MARDKERKPQSKFSNAACTACGARLLKARFKCVRCGAWNPPGATLSSDVDDGTILLHEVGEGDVKRITTGPWDVNFGKPPGVPIDSVTLIGGEPGAGKSTFALQFSDTLALSTKTEVLYLCAEESKTQIKDRSVRLSLRSKRIRIVPLERMGDVTLDRILANRKFCGVIFDSIAGFTTDQDEAVEIVKRFKEFATEYRMPFIVINHVTKDGDMAGAMRLQHAGDISLMLTKGDKGVIETARLVGDDEYFEITEPRELYTEKSRYGPSGITTDYAMTEKGLIEIEYLEDDEDDD